jgi:hypothetical protein
MPSTMTALDGRPFRSNGEGARGVAPADIGMSPQQRFLLDLNGFLHLKSVLQGEELERCREAAVRYASAEPDSLPPPFDRIRRECDARVHQHTPNTASHLGHAFAFDRSLEHIVFNEQVWPVIMELTDGKPQLKGGVLVCEDHRPGGHGDRPVHLHCAREDGGPRSARFEVANGRIFCDNFVVFPYFDDVHPGDGGLLVLPGSHKSNFERPYEFFGKYGEAHRRQFREDQYPGTGKFGEFAGKRWHDLFEFDGTLDEEAMEMGMRAVCPKVRNAPRPFPPPLNFLMHENRYQVFCHDRLGTDVRKTNRKDVLTFRTGGRCAHHAGGAYARGPAVAPYRPGTPRIACSLWPRWRRVLDTGM